MGTKYLSYTVQSRTTKLSKITRSHSRCTNSFKCCWFHLPDSFCYGWEDPAHTLIFGQERNMEATVRCNRPHTRTTRVREEVFLRLNSAWQLLCSHSLHLTMEAGRIFAFQVQMRTRTKSTERWYWGTGQWQPLEFDGSLSSPGSVSGGAVVERDI